MIAVIIILTVPRNSLAQSSRLKVGDDVPDIALKNLINYKTDSEKLHSFKDKFIILYFWNEGCSSSIQSWPALQGLQEKFKKDISIILVNDSQSKDDVQRIYKEQKQFHKVDVILPTVCDDLTLLKYFPFG
jgi:thiol-disulfide isomerase/thioredoxin